MIIVDASVAVKWFLPEPDSDRAASLLRDAQKIFAPELIRVEVASAITRRVRLGELKPAHAREACAAWADALVTGVVGLSRNEHDLERAVLFALELKHPLQDCLYLAHAERLAAPLVTADRKFAANARTLYREVQTL